MEHRGSDSPRITLVRNKAAELVALAAKYGATGVSLCGSVDRGDDIEGSDIDFYVNEFLEPKSLDARERADQLVFAFRQVLAPFKVDVRGIPGWLLGPEHEASMKRDAIDLQTLALPEPPHGRPRDRYHRNKYAI